MQDGSRRHLEFVDIDCVSTDFEILRFGVYMCKKWDLYHF